MGLSRNTPMNRLYPNGAPRPNARVVTKACMSRLDFTAAYLVLFYWGGENKPTIGLAIMSADFELGVRSFFTSRLFSTAAIGNASTYEIEGSEEPSSC